MIRAERIEKIKSLAEGQDIVTWEELQDCLNVSKATAQRDANILSEAGIVQKTRGGVIFVQSPYGQELSYEAREITNIAAKRNIASAALRFVQKGACIMMDSGSTVMEVVHQLPADMPLTAITYSLSTAAALDSKPHTEIYFTGGKLRKKFRACHGYFAENMLSQFHANICFLGADSVNLENGVCEHNMYDVRLKQIMIENSDKVILLVDHSKFHNSPFIHVAPIDHVDVIITDAHLDPEIISELEKRKIEVIEVSATDP